jgi:hypothetical protein
MEGDVILTGSDIFSSLACFVHLRSFCGIFICSSTGTPEGVGPVRVGQKIKAGITDLIDVEFDVRRRNRSFSAWCNKQESNGKQQVLGAYELQLFFLIQCIQ